MGLNGFKKDISGINVDKVWQKKGMLAYQGLSDFFLMIFFNKALWKLAPYPCVRKTKKTHLKDTKKDIHCTSQTCLEEEFFCGFSIVIVYVDFFWEINSHCFYLWQSFVQFKQLPLSSPHCSTLK